MNYNDIIEKQIRILKYGNDVPYLAWINRLRDRQAKQKIRARINRLRVGNFGPTRSVGEGVRELIVNYGPGYRVYFGQDGTALIVLLIGGDKSTQNEDIKQAKKYWESYKQEKIYIND